jgi:hypothetical protein
MVAAGKSAGVASKADGKQFPHASRQSCGTKFTHPQGYTKNHHKNTAPTPETDTRPNAETRVNVEAKDERGPVGADEGLGLFQTLPAFHF